MSFHAADQPDVGYFAEEEPGYGYFGQDYPVEGYGFADPAGYYGDEYVLEPVGVHGSMGWYGDQEPVEGYGYFAQDYPAEGYGYGYPLGYYGQEYVPPEVAGYYGPLAGYAQPPDSYRTMGWYGDQDISGYVREVAPTFNAGCPMPTNVAGFGEADSLEGYVRPETVNARCQQFTPQPGPSPSEPETFKPLW